MRWVQSVVSVLPNILPNVLVVFQRFPLSVILAFLLSAYLIYGVANRLDVTYYSFALMTLFFVTVGAALYTERFQLPRIIGWLLALVGCGFFGSLYFLPEDFHLTPYMMPVAVLLFAGTLAYLGRGHENRAYWQFNHTYWFGLVIAVLGSLLIAGLVSLLIATYGLLFGVFISDRVYQYALIVCVFFVGLVFWLSLLPDHFEEKVVEGPPQEFTSKITALFVQYVFVPFFLLFSLLFHGLAIKVLLDGTMPAGQVAAYGVALITAGILTYLMAFPTRNVSGPLVKLFVNHWMWLLFVPLALVGYAFYLRIEQYGMTPWRFYLLGFLLWAVVLLIYAFFVKLQRQEFDLRVIVLLAGMIVGLASVGPWGAEAISNQWQKQRLVMALAEVGVIKDGKIVSDQQDKKTASPQTYQIIRQSMNYFRKGYRGDQLMSLLNDQDLSALQDLRSDGKRFGYRKNRVVKAVDKALGSLQRSPLYKQAGPIVRYRVARPYGLSLPSKGKLYGPFYLNFGPNRKVANKSSVNLPRSRQAVVRRIKGEEIFNLELGEDRLSFVKNTQRIGAVPLASLQDFARQHQTFLKTQTGLEGDSGLDAITGLNDKGDVRLLVSSLAYKFKAPDKITLMDGQFWLFIAE